MFTTRLPTSKAAEAKRLLPLGLSLLPVVVSAALLTLGLASPEALRRLADRMSGDGDAATLVQDNLIAAKDRVLFSGAALLLISSALAVLALRTPWPRLRSGTASARQGLTRFFRTEHWHAWMLSALVLLNIALGALLLSKPISCDEAYTSLFFASRSPLFILCNYISPNNHVLHTLAANASYSLFGESLFALRLPAMMAGVLTVPAGYLATRVHFGRRPALLAAALIATWPFLVDVDTNARGYSTLNACVLFLIALLPRLLRPDANRGWVFFIILSTIGFITVPVMIYPFAFLALWLALSARRKLSGSEFRGFVLRMGMSVVAVVFATFVFYLPSILLHGASVAFTRDFVRPQLPGSNELLLQQMAGGYAWIWNAWQFSVAPGLLFLLCAIGLIGLWLSPSSVRATARYLAATAVVGPLAIILATSKVPPGRCISFLLPLILILTAAGSVAFLDRLPSWSWMRKRTLLPLCVVALVATNVAGTIEHRTQHWRMPWYVGYHDAEEAARFLLGSMKPDERIAGIREERPSLHYYYERLTGEYLRAFYPFGPEERERIRINYDMSAEDRPEDVARVYLIDTYHGGLEKLHAVLERSGFRRSTQETTFSHSRLLHYDRTLPDLVENHR